LSYYEASPSGIPKARHLPDFTHKGRVKVVDEIMLMAHCDCLFRGPLREYPYEASEDLLKHYRKAGTLYDEDDERFSTRKKMTRK
jgi:hypothetical protein